MSVLTTYPDQTFATKQDAVTGLQGANAKRWVIVNADESRDDELSVYFFNGATLFLVSGGGSNNLDGYARLDADDNHFTGSVQIDEELRIGNIQTLDEGGVLFIGFNCDRIATGESTFAVKQRDFGGSAYLEIDQYRFSYFTSNSAENEADSFPDYAKQAHFSAYGSLVGRKPVTVVNDAAFDAEAGDSDMILLDGSANAINYTISPSPGAIGKIVEMKCINSTHAVTVFVTDIPMYLNNDPLTAVTEIELQAGVSLRLLIGTNRIDQL